MRQNMKVPLYKESFVFDQFKTSRELQCCNLWFGVMETTSCSPKLLGEANVELAQVWSQKQHTIAQKWVQLTKPSCSEAGSVGFLKVDISIKFHREMMPTAGPCRENTDDLLLTHGEQQPACYQLTIYKAYGVPCSPRSRPDTAGRLPSTSLRVTFCGLVGETSTRTHTIDPVYLERISIVEMFPNLCQTMHLEVCSVNGAKVLASTSLKLSQISHRGENGFLPTFGPSLLHMYGPWPEPLQHDGPYHRGALLVTMKTLVPYYKQSVKSVCVEQLTTTLPETEWIFEDFVLLCPLFEVSMLDKKWCGNNCGVAVTWYTTTINSSIDQDYLSQQCEISTKKLHYTGGLSVDWFSNLGHLKLSNYPILQQAVRLPDFRFSMFMNNMLREIVDEMDNDLLRISTSLTLGNFKCYKNLQDSIHCAKDNAAAKIQKFLDIIEYSICNQDMKTYSTELDLNFLQLQKDKIGKIYRCLTAKKSCRSILERLPEDKHSKKTVKLMLAEAKLIVEDLKTIIFQPPGGWADISLWLLSNGSRVAYAKIYPGDVIHSVIPEQCGRRLGKIQTIYLKPIKCPKHATAADCCCICGKVELLVWLGTFRWQAAFHSFLPNGYELSTACAMSVKCQLLRVECCFYIYRAKLECENDPLFCKSPFVRVHFMNVYKDTEVRDNTLAPVWNELLRINCNAHTSRQRLESSPPVVLVEIYHCDATQTGKIDLLGRLELTPLFLNSSEYAPALDWHVVQMGTQRVGTIQMSTQITLNKLASEEKEGLTTTACPIDCVSPGYNIREPLPVKLLPERNAYKMDVYWWGLRNVNITQKPCMTLELEDMVMKSSVITDYGPNCNFYCDRISKTFQGDIANCYPLTLKLYDSTTFGRTRFVGWNTVKRPGKYLVQWTPKETRKEKLFAKHIVSHAYMLVNTRKLVKKNEMNPICEYPEENYIKEKGKPKCFLERLFSKKNDEEEIMLLPVFSKYSQNTKSNEDNWWLRYYISLNDKASSDQEITGNRLMIYDSELEAQPGFSNFKDWCKTIKIYNGEKTGLPERDEQLMCGILKVCIAIYEWPPPTTVVAVNNCGIDLDRGYFHGYPDNDPVRCLVRVYAVKCSGLVTKGFTKASNCYVSVQCGSEEVGNWSSCVPRSSEPVFGNIHELHCTLPEDYLLKVSVMDCTPSQPDSMIGCTSIDLEDRVYTKHRSTVGLGAEYFDTGPNKWRDSQKPSKILQKLCIKNNLPPPEFPEPSTVVLNGVEYKDPDLGVKYSRPLLRREGICLSIIRNWHTLPVCGYKLVPEHVEARTLYNPERPGVEQGKIHLWVDIFFLDSGQVPPPVDITPCPAEQFELRVIVWDVLDLKLPNKGSNIFVKAWIGPSDEAQDTEIYYNSLNGEGHFNWRMIFQFQYRRTERKLLLHDKGPFTEVTELFPPILVVEVLDIEAPNPEDYLGTLMLDLSAMPRGARLARHCTPDIMQRQKIDLFVARTVRGWWPLKRINRNTGNYYSAGIIDLEVSLLTKEKALIMSVGLGRDPPAPLPDPIQFADRTTANGVNWSHRSFPVRLDEPCTPKTAVIVIGLVCFGAYVLWNVYLFLLDARNFLGRSTDHKIVPGIYVSNIPMK